MYRFGHQKRLEEDKPALYPDLNKARLYGLIKRRKEYEARIDSIKMSIALNHWGQNLQDVQSGVVKAEEAAYRERPYAVTTVSRSKSSWLKKPKWVSKGISKVGESLGFVASMPESYD